MALGGCAFVQLARAIGCVKIKLPELEVPARAAVKELFAILSFRTATNIFTCHARSPGLELIPRYDVRSYSMSGKGGDRKGERGKGLVTRRAS